MKELYNLKCGERYAPNRHSMWIRVPGGWIYGDMQGTCFVPFDNEFQQRVDFDNTQQLKDEILTLLNDALDEFSEKKFDNGKYYLEQAMSKLSPVL